MLTLGDQTDEHGRLLLEDSAPKRAQKTVQRQGVRMKPVPSPYTDTPSRQGGLVNIAAYEALRHDTADILNGFGWLTRRYGEMNPGRRGTVKALFDVSYLGLSLPLVLFHRADDPVPGQGRLPSHIASMYKASRGVFSAAVDLLNRTGPPSPVTAAEVVAFADEHGHLKRGQTRRVCAAPTRLIERTIGVMLGQEAADPARSDLAGAVDFAVLWPFCTMQEALSQALSELGYVMGQLNEDGRFRDRDELFAGVVTVAGVRQSLATYAESVLRRANAVQVGLNDLLGRSDDPPPIGADELLRML
ncbi:MAG: hypothetical protein LC792_15320 [Actinobacteria bacterium]|nr:hypothetical protein [Actinomycetota bacterium]